MAGPMAVAFKNAHEDRSLVHRMREAFAGDKPINEGEAAAVVGMNGGSVLRTAAQLRAEPKGFLEHLRKNDCIGENHPLMRAAAMPEHDPKAPRPLGEVFTKAQEAIPVDALGPMDRISMKAYERAVRKGKAINGEAMTGFLENVAGRIDRKGRGAEATELGKLALESHDSWKAQERQAKLDRRRKDAAR